MQIPSLNHPALSASNLRPLLDWLGSSHHGLEPQQHAAQLLRHLLALRDAAIPNASRTQLLDLLFKQVRHMVSQLLPALPRQKLPITHRMRLHIATAHRILDAQAQEYLNTLAECFNDGSQLPPLAGHPLLKTMQCYGWSILIANKCHAPSRPGIWLSLHASYTTARRLGIEQLSLDGDGHTPAQLYSTLLLTQMAQPAALNAVEFQFVADYLARLNDFLPHAFDQAPANTPGLHWLDTQRDQPTQAIVRRLPPPDSAIRYLACDDIAARARSHLAALEAGRSAAELGLPEFAQSSHGQGLLGHLADAWGAPPKRRFPRRKNAFRLRLLAGLEQIVGGKAGPWSEWLVTNESPNGFALMHVAGDLGSLALGQVVRLHIGDATAGNGQTGTQIGIVRWTLSDNPEHFEIGIELVSSQARQVIAAQPGHPDPGRHSALLLPAMLHGCDQPRLLTSSKEIRPEFGTVIVIEEQQSVTLHDYLLQTPPDDTEHVFIWRVTPAETR